MKNVITIIVLLLIASGCKKYSSNRNDIGGDLYLRGRVFTVDEINGGSTENPAAGVIIALGRTDNNVTTYFVTVTTDSDGYFIFEHLMPNIDYHLKADYKRANDSILYILDAERRLDGDVADVKYVLRPADRKQNGLVYIVQDSSGNAVPKCTISIYNNTITANDSGKNATYYLNTGISGRAAKLNIPAGKYAAYVSLDVNNTRYAAKNIIDMVGNEGIVYRTVKLEAIPAIMSKGITFIVRDTAGGVVEGCRVCIFNSLALANDSCSGSVINGLTDKYGKLVLSDIPEGTLYIYFIREVGSAKLKGSYTIENYKEDKMYYVDTVRIR